MRLVLCVAAAMVVCSCGGNGGTDRQAPAAGSDPLPLQVGNRWVVLGHDNRSGSDQTITEEVIGATPSADGVVYTTSRGQILERTPAEVRRMPGDPALAGAPVAGPVLLLKLPLQVGDRWTQFEQADTSSDHDGDGVHDTDSHRSDVSVLRTESIATPAGTFADAIVVQTIETWNSSRSASPAVPLVSSRSVLTWYAPGVGVVHRETSSSSAGVPSFHGFEETLLSYAVR